MLTTAHSSPTLQNISAVACCFMPCTFISGKNIHFKVIITFLISCEDISFEVRAQFFRSLCWPRIQDESQT